MNTLYKFDDRVKSSLFKIDGAKHLSFVDDDHTKYWLKITKRAQTIFSQ